LAGFLAIPIFFAALMAASLAIEKPRVVEWSRPGGRIARIYHDPSASLEAKIWGLAILVALSVVAVGWFASFLRYGIFVTCGAAIAVALALTVRLDRWKVHHTTRFPNGEDLYPDNSTSSLVARGEWEHNAAHAAYTLIEYTVALALIAAAIVVALAVRRRRGPMPVTPELPPMQTGGAPSTTLPS
jgi:hypothetical protein